MEKPNRLKETLEWLHHAYWIREFIISSGLSGFAVSWIGRHIHIPGDLIWPVRLLCVGALMYLLAFVRTSWQRKKSASASAQLGAATAQVSGESGPPYKTKEFWRLKSEEENAERTKCEAERRTALEKVKDLEERLSLFTPLQIEAFRLARDIGEFDLPMQPAYKRAMSDEEINSKLQQHLQSNLKFSSAYSLNLAPRVKTLMHRLGEQGVNANELIHFTEGIADVQQIPVLRARIVRLAHALDGVELKA
jgi:hypothetical protein